MERNKGQQVKMLWCLLFISLIGSVQCNDHGHADSGNKCGNFDKIDVNIADRVIYPKVTEPSSGVSSWWTIDLLVVHKIYCIGIKPQLNADLMMEGAEVHVGNRWNHSKNKNCTKIKALTPEQWSNFACTEPVSGHYITVHNPGQTNFSLPEVEIYGQERDLINTKGIPTSQSSGGGDHISKNAVDGHETRCAITEEEKNSWWRIDLPVPYKISYIIIYDTDNIIDINNIHIHIGNSLENNGTDNKRCKTNSNLKNGYWVYFKCQYERTGRYVTVVSLERSLTLCEVKLIGKIKDLIKTTNSITSQSTNFINEDKVPYSSGRAIDGKIELCAHTLEKKDSAFWKIDLLDVYTISFFSIYNQDHHNSNINGAQIHIGNSRESNGTNNKMCTKITGFKLGLWNYLKCGEVSGRYITVFLPGPKPLVLCEVKIIGKKKVSPFKLINQKKTWEEALDHCRDRNWDLASILDEEDQALAEVEARKANTPFVWLGLHYTCVLDAWFWVANHRLDFSRWGPGGLQRECDLSATMERVEDHQWYSKNDSDRFNFICQK